MRIDDSMDVFAEHGVAGMVGLMFNALFGTDAIVGLDGVSVGAVNSTTNTPVGGWLIHNYRQFYIQLAYILACTGYSFVVSAIIAYAINLVPGLNLRASEEAELLGMDDDQLGEFAYDYVEVRRDYLAWTPQHHIQNEQGHFVSRSNIYGINEHVNMVFVPPSDQAPPTKEFCPVSASHSSTQLPPSDQRPDASAQTPNEQVSPPPVPSTGSGSGQ